MSVLTQEDHRCFRETGFLRLERAFGADLAEQQRTSIWKELGRQYGVRESDRDTWQQPPKQLRRTRDDPRFQAMGTERLRGALDELLGPDGWERSGKRNWGSVLFTFPNAKRWDVPAKTWHWDNPIPPHLDGCAAVQVFTLLADHEPGGGATVFVEGMHRVLVDYYQGLSAAERERKHAQHRAHAMKSHPWLDQLQWNDPPVSDRAALFLEEGATIGGVPVRVREMTGRAGDAYLVHPLLAHTWAPNASERPRMMRGKMVVKKGFDWAYLLAEAS